MLVIPLKTQLVVVILLLRPPAAVVGFLEQAKFNSAVSDVHTPWSIYYDKMQSALLLLPLC